MLRHFLATLAYRTQKALRDAPPSFGDYAAGNGIRTPRELVRHMTSVLGYARTFLIGGAYSADPLPDLDAEVARFHEMLEDLGSRLAAGEQFQGITPEKILQGPFADAMTHAGQLALLRRLSGAPVPAENSSRPTSARRTLDPCSPSLPRPAAATGSGIRKAANPRTRSSAETPRSRSP